MADHPIPSKSSGKPSGGASGGGKKPMGPSLPISSPNKNLTEIIIGVIVLLVVVPLLAFIVPSETGNTF